MTMTRRTVLAFPVVTAIPALARAQAPVPAAPAPTRAGKVFLSGENPVIRLLDKPGGTALTQASYWRIHWSPVGPGHVCYLTVGDQKSAGSVRVALHDNAKLAEYLTKEVLGTFNKSYLDWPFTPIGGASFTAGGDNIKERRESCKADKYNVDLVWRDQGTPELVDILPGSRPTNPFGITYLRIYARTAEVTINGKPAPGTSYPNVSFLAFGETWLK